MPDEPQVKKQRQDDANGATKASEDIVAAAAPKASSAPVQEDTTSGSMTGVVEKRLEEAGITLPKLAPAGSYVLCRRSGNLLYLSGHLPKAADGTLTTGKVGSEVKLEEAIAAARVVGINLISTMKDEVGDLDKIRLVKLMGFVNSSHDFTEQHKVLNGTSDLMNSVFGPENGAHARSAVGVNTLPLGLSVEVEAIAEVLP